MKKTNKRIIALVTLILSIAIISILTFTLWKTANQLVDDLLMKLGISGFYLKAGIIFVFGILLLILLGIVNKKIKILKSIKDVFKL